MGQKNKKPLVKPQIIKVDSNLDYEIKESGKYIFELNRSGAFLNLKSTLSAHTKEKINLDILIHHKAENTKAETTLKAAGFDQSQIDIRAKILIDPNCPQTESFLTERVLLVSKKAKAIAIPDLEILTDDVKCSHAASVSRIPEKQIFYMMIRGVSRQKAEEMIVEGFLN